MEHAFIPYVLPNMPPLHHIINMAHGTADQQRKYERHHILFLIPHVYIDTRQNCQKRESPGDTIDNGSFTIGEELIDDITE
jgi:hypothetical protein